MNCSEEFLELVQFVLTLWGILIEHSIDSTLWERGKPIQENHQLWGNQFPLSNLLFLYVKGDPKRFYLLLTHSRNHFIFPVLLFFFFFFLNQQKQARELSIIRAKEKALAYKIHVEKRGKVVKKRQKCQPAGFHCPWSAMLCVRLCVYK